MANAFLKEIETRLVSMQRYEEPGIQTKALSLIPVILLQIRAQERMRSIQKDIKNGILDDVNISIEELLLLELLSWFKDSFFTWIDSPDCDYCDGKTIFSHMSTDSALFVLTDRVEMHKCTSCERFTEFARYNDLAILLKTREGRCGECATIFTLMCLAMGWEARFVCDVTDHVWTEVYSIAQRRWLHCDPCENICDNPLVYETGWKKQLSYVMAYSVNDVQDVTWRYSANHAAVLQRRNKCEEADLVRTILKLRERKQCKLSVSHRKYLTKIAMLELAEMMVEKVPTDADRHGRTSGSLAWRGQRGEVSASEPKIWSPTNIELAAGKMTIRYSIVKDRYENVLANGKIMGTLLKWNLGVFRATNMARKEEKDWKMVYLCRSENSTEAQIEWRFELRNTKKKFDQVTVKITSKTYENGAITIQLCDDNQSVRVPGNGEPLTTSAFSGKESFSLIAFLKGGRGDCSFQHTQLFRESINEKNYPFSITITFKNKIPFL